MNKKQYDIDSFEEKFKQAASTHKASAFPDVFENIMKEVSATAGAASATTSTTVSTAATTTFLTKNLIWLLSAVLITSVVGVIIVLNQNEEVTPKIDSEEENIETPIKEDSNDSVPLNTLPVGIPENEQGGENASQPALEQESTTQEVAPKSTTEKEGSQVEEEVIHKVTQESVDSLTTKNTETPLIKSEEEHATSEADPVQKSSEVVDESAVKNEPEVEAENTQKAVEPTKEAVPEKTSMEMFIEQNKDTTTTSGGDLLFKKKKVN